jgi:hypothetical protein
MSQLFSDSARHRRIGIALVTVTTLMFAVLDASAKWLVLTLPVVLGALVVVASGLYLLWREFQGTHHD